ncbi:GvpL/GvpF family gas vesicle protein [Hoyosella sp. YIM 151337]|uniref:GvpL/GvpF family gas vesicle protein n=1 Tax=Hoyosella sp. YIM 151337 TaxID=2992742 RepID=UPI0022363840|nr:GvpL/GvpF family gas vesicle protein [Hoyosella sp. YIM 151337]MCW4351788.1 GvpL/GvpF family gas vesicle protein [Hoyosella sp. YIM 151337]
MSEQASTRQQERTAVYVYGIVAASEGDEAKDVSNGGPVVGGGEQTVRKVQHGSVAALVSDVQVSQPLGQPEDLMAHARVLDEVAAKTTVLPFSFGAVVTDEQAVIDELIEPNTEQLRSALRELEGKVEFLVKARYIEESILREVLTENEDAAKLRESLVGQPEDATRETRLALGELISTAIEAKRQADTEAAGELLRPLATASSVRNPTHELDAFGIALLMERDRQQDLEQAVGELAKSWSERADVTLYGPIAAYDFVVTQSPEA